MLRIETGRFDSGEFLFLFSLATNVTKMQFIYQKSCANYQNAQIHGKISIRLVYNRKHYWKSSLYSYSCYRRFLSFWVRVFGIYKEAIHCKFGSNCQLNHQRQIKSIHNRKNRYGERLRNKCGKLKPRIFCLILKQTVSRSFQDSCKLSGCSIL